MNSTIKRKTAVAVILVFVFLLVWARAQVAPQLQAQPETDGIHVIGLPGTAGALVWTATGNTTTPLANPAPNETHSIPIVAGQTTVIDQSVPNGWVVAYSFNGGPNVIAQAAGTQDFTQPATQPTTPPTVVTKPAPQPVLYYIGFSRDGGQTWTTIGSVQAAWVPTTQPAQ